MGIENPQNLSQLWRDPAVQMFSLWRHRTALKPLYSAAFRNQPPPVFKCSTFIGHDLPDSGKLRAMHKKLLPKVKQQAQDRSELAVQNILEAADAAFDEHDPSNLNARKLAAKAGYSVGTLYYYLSKAEDAFILMIIKRREKHFTKLAELIDAFPGDQPLPALLAAMVDASFEEYNRMNHRSFFLVFRMILKFSKNPLAFDDALSILVRPLLAAQQRDTTGTFRQTDANELLMLLKTCFAMIRRPFLEQNPIAGSEQHRALTLDTMQRLLGNPTFAAVRE